MKVRFYQLDASQTGLGGVLVQEQNQDMLK